MTYNIDNKRTGLKLIVGQGEFDMAKYWNEPGIAWKVTFENEKNEFLSFSCPGCGATSIIKVGKEKPEERPSWQITNGDLDNLSILSLQPSIDCKGCCGWHGYLTNGVFNSV